ncbi:MAG TPA: hypothetical protein VHR88_06945 [Solirubrobacteraceae bacterium]|jgi:hypothetical protein|nr:hypothetical protein [Solirubrobacteraceae bacterium]
MGRRSRKRARPAGERVVEAPPAAPPTRRERERSRRDRLPPPPWAPFPLVELAVLAALIIGIVGFFSSGRRGAILLVCAAVLGSLAGLEITIREHFAGFKSHTTVLSAAVAVAVMAVAFFAGGPRWLVVAVGVPVFVFSFFLLRNAFARRSGGYTMR